MNQGLTAPDLKKFLDRETSIAPKRDIEYVASPYWHPNPQVRKARAKAALAGTIMLIERDVAALSPVVYSATIQEQENFSPPEGWYGFDLHFLATAKAMTVLEVPGWEQSRGILIEMGFARGRGLPIGRVKWPEIREKLDPETVRILEDPEGATGE